MAPVQQEHHKTFFLSVCWTAQIDFYSHSYLESQGTLWIATIYSKEDNIQEKHGLKDNMEPLFHEYWNGFSLYIYIESKRHFELLNIQLLWCLPEYDLTKHS